MSLKKTIKRFLSPEMRDFLHDTRALFNRISGIDTHKYGLYHPIARRQMIFDIHRIDVVLDVGANRGQFGGQIRRAGYKKTLHSFEPLSSAYTLLEKKAAKDPLWHTHYMGLGERDGSALINISSNSQSSSMLAMTSAHTNADDSSAYVGQEETPLHRLDTVFPQFCTPSNRIFLKLDAQGMEESIIRGAEESLRHIPFVQAELSFVTLYEGETLFMDFLRLMEAKGYRVVFIDQGFSDIHTAFALQCDVIFYRDTGSF